MNGTAPNWSKDMVDQTNKRWMEFWDWAEKSGVPLPLRESLLRDALASIEGLRLRTYIPVLQLDKELLGHLNVSMDRGSFVKK